MFIIIDQVNLKCKFIERSTSSNSATNPITYALSSVTFDTFNDATLHSTYKIIIGDGTTTASTKGKLQSIALFNRLLTDTEMDRFAHLGTRSFSVYDTTLLHYY